jgi:hypothetical protein
LNPNGFATDGIGDDMKVAPISMSEGIAPRPTTLEMLARGMVLAVTCGKLGFSKINVVSVIRSLPDTVCMRKGSAIVIRVGASSVRAAADRETGKNAQGIPMDWTPCPYMSV